MRNLKKTIWRTSAGVAILLSIITFTPLVIPRNEFEPELMGIPYTFWTGILIMISYLLVIMMAIYSHPGDNIDR